MSEWMLRLVLERLLSDDNLKQFKSHAEKFLREKYEENKPRLLQALREEAEKTGTPLDDYAVSVLAKLL